MRCARHPEIETNLTCGKCGQAICPKCLVQTPVGARCRECAGLKRLPVFEIAPIYYVRATIAGLVAAAVLGAVWPFIPLGGFLLFLMALGIGYAIGEVVSVSVNRKRGRGLQIIAGAGMVLSYVTRSALETSPSGFTDSLLDIYGLLALALGIIIAVDRLR